MVAGIWKGHIISPIIYSLLFGICWIYLGPVALIGFVCAYIQNTSTMLSLLLFTRQTWVWLTLCNLRDSLLDPIRLHQPSLRNKESDREVNWWDQGGRGWRDELGEAMKVVGWMIMEKSVACRSCKASIEVGMQKSHFLVYTDHNHIILCVLGGFRFDSLQWLNLRNRQVFSFLRCFSGAR